MALCPPGTLAPEAGLTLALPPQAGLLRVVLGSFLLLGPPAFP